MSEAMSPTNSASINAMTPKGDMSQGHFNFNLPSSTTNAGSKRFDLSTPKSRGGFDLSTPKGSKAGPNLSDFKVGFNMPTTPKITSSDSKNKMGNFDFMKGNKDLDLIEESDEDSEQPRRESQKMVGNRLVSPRAELARNTLAERQKATLDGTDQEGDQSKQLPEEEYEDFLQTYEEPKKWWIGKPKDTPEDKPAINAEGDDSGKLNSLMIEGQDSDSEDDFPTLDEWITQQGKQIYYEMSTLKQRFTDINRQPRLIKDLFPAPL